MLARAVAQSGQIHQPIFWGSGAEIDAGTAAGGQTKIDATQRNDDESEIAHLGETPGSNIKQPAQP